MFAYCLNRAVNGRDASGCLTVGVGLDVSAAFGIRAGASAQVVVDDNGNIGILVTYSIGGGTPSASFSAIGSFTNADTIEDLTGMGGAFGASGIAGADFTVGTAKNGDSVYGVQVSKSIVSAPMPIEAHGEATYSVLYSLDWLPKRLRKLIANELIKQINQLQ